MSHALYYEVIILFWCQQQNFLMVLKQVYHSCMNAHVITFPCNGGAIVFSNCS